MKKQTAQGWHVLLVLALFYLNSCKTEKPGVNPDGKPVFVDKKWLAVSSTVSPKIDLNGDGIPDEDLYAPLPDCEKDDKISFRGDGKYVLDNGGKRCDAIDPAEEQLGTWTYTSDNKTLLIKDSEGEEQHWVVQESTATRLKMQNTTAIEGTNYTITVVLKAD
ncbi:lipocalin family protein [Persicitalea jodogahamensis]|uniref:Lipocalin-like domain-containing protein n=1 Tax=Persicitalea jodogahamensis TaxID=402147 RepID=A0A8J3D880_9BACT|nr:lipocalin family protein [Persicitalea jodogahamensis]GHB75436.1 hypothetical protein GCM10007390_31470 [Persicitalea jodogahamensis]